MRPPQPAWRRYLLVPVVALLGVNLVVLASFTLPRLSEERHSAERLATLRERVERQRERTEALRERAEVAQANAEQLARFYDEVVCRGEAERLALVRSLQRDLEDVGVVSKRRSWSVEKVRELPLERFSGTLPAEGRYEQLTDLLERLERSEAFLIVESVQLRHREGTAASLDLSVATYCRAPEGRS